MSTGSEDPTLVPAALDETIAGGADAPTPRRHSEELARGDTLGRYVVLERLGAGAMGVVYAAYDPELDRKVAVKLLRADPGSGGSEASEGHVRLLREAQAMAQLVHANVITVHDVGVVDDRVFVAMEFVDGGTLSQWLERSERPIRDIVDCFVEAGRGLAAAHAKGLVHRDFKPENVLVSEDGRVLVTDFGLARPVEAPPDEEKVERSTPHATTDALSISMTAPGAIMGTPAYMSPEQHLGGTVGPASDQFGFCVALYEALYKERPFAGDSFAALAFQVSQGKVRDPPAGSRVPRPLRRILLRGLSARERDRWPSMGALLAQLERDPARTRRMWLIGAAAATLIVGAVLGGRASREPVSEPCREAAQIMSAVWDAARASRVNAAFLAVEKPYAEHAARRTEERLSEYARSWTNMHTEACRATHVSGEQSEHLLDLRMTCLQQRLDELDSLAELFESADEQTVKKAPVAVQSLTPLSRCADVEALRRPTAIPADPEIRERVAAVRADVARANAHRRSGKYVEGLEIATAATARARELGFGPTLAEALQAEGDLLSKGGDMERAADAHRQALAAALASNHLDVAANAWIDVIWRDGVSLHRHEEALRWVDVAAAALVTGGRGDLEGHRLNTIGAIYFEKPNFELAEDYFERALAFFAEADRMDDPTVGTLLNNLGSVMGAQGRFEEARQYLERSVAFREALYGPSHPLVASALENLARALGELGDYEEAERVTRRAYEMQRANLGAEHPLVADAAYALGSALNLTRKYDEALEMFELALKIHEATSGPDSPDIASVAVNMSVVLQAIDRPEEARASLERALMIREKAFGSGHPRVASVLNNLASVYLDQKNYAKARELDQRALAILEAALGPDNQESAEALTGLGDVAMAEKRYEEALPYYEHAIRVREAVSGPTHPSLRDPVWGSGLAHFHLGRTTRAIELFERGRELSRKSGNRLAQASTEARLIEALGKVDETERARALAEQMLAETEDLEGAEELRETVRSWLREHDR